VMLQSGFLISLEQILKTFTEISEKVPKSLKICVIIF
jgi:hypothetical protein